MTVYCHCYDDYMLYKVFYNYVNNPCHPLTISNVIPLTNGIRDSER